MFVNTVYETKSLFMKPHINKKNNTDSSVKYFSHAILFPDHSRAADYQILVKGEMKSFSQILSFLTPL